MIPTEDRQDAVEDPLGLSRPTDRHETPEADDLADSLSELPEARLVSTPDRPREVLTSDDPVTLRSRRLAGQPTPGGIAYPEWDMKTRTYRTPGATVRPQPPREGSEEWVRSVLMTHGPLIRAVRRRFERLRARRIHLTRQPAGAEPDLAAYVEAYADLRSGHPVDDRFYLDTRRLRRECPIMLLIDTSASTDSWVESSRRVIDVEKEALLMVCEALEALGDRFGILSFSSEGPHAVHVRALRAFGECAPSRIRLRVAGLEPDGYTRIGAALRHATAQLRAEMTHHGLLIVLSDGKPNDIDQYEGVYGIEDARRAVLEARGDGLTVFCLTIDRAPGPYLSRVFGDSGFAVLRRVSTLPTALLMVLRQLVAR